MNHWTLHSIVHGVVIVMLAIAYHDRDRSFGGRPIWHVPTRIWNRSADDQSQQFGDIYSFTHILHGLILSFILQHYHVSYTYNVLITLGIEMVWEFFENTAWMIDHYRSQHLHREYAGDSWVNTLGDVYFTYIGIVLSYILTPSQVLLYMIISEWLMCFIYKDNMLSNIVLILYHIII